MANQIPVQDREHFAIAEASLAQSGMHVAMVGGERRKLQNYAAALAAQLAQVHGMKVEAYQSSRLESIIVDLLLHRFDGALSRISGLSPSASHLHQAHTGRNSCALFIAEAQTLSRAEFNQLVRLAAGTRGQGLRLVALFDDSNPQENDERIRAMGTQVVRWDLDDIDESFAAGQHAANVTKRLPSPYRWRQRTQGMMALTAAIMMAIIPAMLMPSSSQSKLSMQSHISTDQAIHPGPLSDPLAYPVAATSDEPYTATDNQNKTAIVPGQRLGSSQLAGTPVPEFARAAEQVRPAPASSD